MDSLNFALWSSVQGLPTRFGGFHVRLTVLPSLKWKTISAAERTSIWSIWLSNSLPSNSAMPSVSAMKGFNKSSRKPTVPHPFLSAHRQYAAFCPPAADYVAFRKLQPHWTHLIFAVKQDEPFGFVPFLRLCADTFARYSGVQQSWCPVFGQSRTTVVPSFR